MSPISLLVVDDHALVREGLCLLLRSCLEIADIREAACAEAAIETIAGGYYPDLVLLDLVFPDASGIQPITAIKSRWPDLPVLVLTMHDAPAVARSAIEAGAQGFVTKCSSFDVLIFAIKQIFSGAKYFDASVVEGMMNERPRVAAINRPTVLSPREQEILRQLATGMSVQAIADQLGLSRKTVSTYKARVMDKMGFSSNADLIRYSVLAEPRA
jgi:DNA-binding NarL/FixJ family response regulator